ncbi:MAG TPA: LysR family transcriptional regulator [Porticoccaceae bacterium]|nr:LysR family transcriptional regulator [Porticoccaceae bacterium]
MDRRDLSELLVFQAVAEAGSFTRAASRLGRTQSGISQAVSSLESRLGVTLVARSTRSSRLTEAGQLLLEQVSPALRQIEKSLEHVKAGHNQPSGTLRITTLEHPARTILMPVLPSFVRRYPEVNIDIDVNDRFVDIVQGGFDAGIRFGSHLEKDTVAMPIGANLRVAIVGAPEYFDQYGRPKNLRDLFHHKCINFRMAGNGSFFRWIFQQGHESIDLSVKGRVSVNEASTLICAALSGMGLAYTFDQHVNEYLKSGALEACLTEYCPEWPGYHIYYPGRRQKTPALVALLHHLRSFI